MATEKRLIDANALRERMFSYYGCVNEHSSKEYYRGETLMSYEIADMIEDCIDNAPTVDAVEVVHGHWIRHYDDLFPAESTQECSVCHEHEDMLLCNENYCPNCGAKMNQEADHG